MVSTYYRELRRILLDHGCTFVRNGKGDHEIWRSPINNRTFTVDAGTRKRYTANAALEPFRPRLSHPDCADFGQVKGARRELCAHIVTDERRGNGAKSARPGGVASGSPSDSVASLARVPDPHCATRLAEELPEAIRVAQSRSERL